MTIKRVHASNNSTHHLPPSQCSLKFKSLFLPSFPYSFPLPSSRLKPHSVSSSCCHHPTTSWGLIKTCGMNKWGWLGQRVGWEKRCSSTRKIQINGSLVSDPYVQSHKQFRAFHWIGNNTLCPVLQLYTNATRPQQQTMGNILYLYKYFSICPAELQHSGQRQNRTWV